MRPIKRHHERAEIPKPRHLWFSYAYFESQDAKMTKNAENAKMPKGQQLETKDAKAALVSNNACFWLSRCQNGIIGDQRSRGDI